MVIGSWYQVMVRGIRSGGSWFAPDEMKDEFNEQNPKCKKNAESNHRKIRGRNFFAGRKDSFKSKRAFLDLVVLKFKKNHFISINKKLKIQ
jgi:hypothetical protein